ncbi:PPOX class F420-dependent oxidoreductase [Streptomyces sp. SID3212]|uniref:PPOX class F420-dependent oxidoreductase n=1 Tax=Streptomyces sp. SID3212 TaxID=2690259 RepID=UPI001371CB9A|nr:PPOX class F420-dependent oxidoreductase [Streptomyces sp. SID3212]MYV55399.1 TIGR03618 family F420-dependent PPOX class oxidoreductase [Streptomyces sp. SID3212]
MASHMSKDQWHAFVSEGTRTAKLSTVRADGSPHIAPVWFLLDGDDLIFNTGKETVKGRNLRRDNRVALCVDDERPPFSFVLVEGRAELSEDPEEVLEWAVRLGARYMGEEQAQAVGERNSGPGEVLVRVRVDKVVNVADIAG